MKKRMKRSVATLLSLVMFLIPLTVSSIALAEEITTIGVTISTTPTVDALPVGDGTWTDSVSYVATDTSAGGNGYETGVGTGESDTSQADSTAEPQAPAEPAVSSEPAASVEPADEASFDVSLDKDENLVIDNNQPGGTTTTIANDDLIEKAGTENDSPATGDAANNVYVEEYSSDNSGAYSDDPDSFYNHNEDTGEDTAEHSDITVDKSGVIDNKPGNDPAGSGTNDNNTPNDESDDTEDVDYLVQVGGGTSISVDKNVAGTKTTIKTPVMEEQKDDRGETVYDADGNPVMVPVMEEKKDEKGETVYDTDGNPVMQAKYEETQAYEVTLTADATLGSAKIFKTDEEGYSVTLGGKKKIILTIDATNSMTTDKVVGIDGNMVTRWAVLGGAVETFVQEIFCEKDGNGNIKKDDQGKILYTNKDIEITLVGYSGINRSGDSLEEVAKIFDTTYTNENVNELITLIQGERQSFEGLISSELLNTSGTNIDAGYTKTLEAVNTALGTGDGGGYKAENVSVVFMTDGKATTTYNETTRKTEYKKNVVAQETADAAVAVLAKGVKLYNLVIGDDGETDHNNRIVQDYMDPKYNPKTGTEEVFAEDFTPVTKEEYDNFTKRYGKDNDNAKITLDEQASLSEVDAGTYNAFVQPYGDDAGRKDSSTSTVYAVKRTYQVGTDKKGRPIYREIWEETTVDSQEWKTASNKNRASSVTNIVTTTYGNGEAVKTVTTVPEYYIKGEKNNPGSHGGGNRPQPVDFITYLNTENKDRIGNTGAKTEETYEIKAKYEVKQVEIKDVHTPGTLNATIDRYNQNLKQLANFQTINRAHVKFEAATDAAGIVEAYQKYARIIAGELADKALIAYNAKVIDVVPEGFTVYVDPNSSEIVSVGVDAEGNQVIVWKLGADANANSEYNEKQGDMWGNKETDADGNVTRYHYNESVSYFLLPTSTLKGQYTYGTVFTNDSAILVCNPVVEGGRQIAIVADRPVVTFGAEAQADKTASIPFADVANFSLSLRANDSNADNNKVQAKGTSVSDTYISSISNIKLGNTVLKADPVAPNQDGSFTYETSLGTLHVTREGVTTFTPSVAWDRGTLGEEVAITFDYTLSFDTQINEYSETLDIAKPVTAEAAITLTAPPVVPDLDTEPELDTEPDPDDDPFTPYTPPEEPVTPPEEPVTPPEGPVTPPEGPVTPTTVEIPAEPVPLAAPAEPAAPVVSKAVVIPEETVPLAPPKGWALVNLICVLLSATGAIATLFVRQREDENADLRTDDNEKIKKQRHALTKVTGGILALLSAIVFIITELPLVRMIYVDKWTVPMAVMLALHIIVMGVGLRKKDPKEDENTSAQA